MIKGYRLLRVPNMDEITFEDVIEMIDPIKSKKIDSISASLYDMALKEFYVDGYVVKGYVSDNPVAIESLMEVYKVIEEADPKLIKVGRYSKRVMILAYNKYPGSSATNFDNLIEELARMSAWLINDFEDSIDPVEKLSDYIRVCVNYDKN